MKRTPTVITGLRADDMPNPIGIDNPVPMLSWALSSDTRGAVQTAYQLRASSTGAEVDTADLWDTREGREHGECRRVRGCWPCLALSRPLEGAGVGLRRCGIRLVRSSHRRDRLLDATDWAGAWVTDPQWASHARPDAAASDARVAATSPDPALPILAKEFTVDEEKVIESARLYVAGLGIYSASVNGCAVSEDVLSPGYTNYRDRVEYSSHDVQPLLVPGANAVGIELDTGPALISDGGGYVKYTIDVSTPKAIAQLEVRYTDSSSSVTATDGSWKSTTGPTTVSNWFSGERYDARLEVPGWNLAGTDRSRWTEVAVLVGERPALSGRLAPPLRITERFDAGEPTTISASTVRYDLPENIAGFMELTVSGPAGAEIELWPGERVNGDGTVDQAAIGTPVFNSVITGGGSTTWRTMFRYDGYRHIEVRGVTPDVTVSGVAGLVVRAATTGSEPSRRRIRPSTRCIG